MQFINLVFRHRLLTVSILAVITAVMAVFYPRIPDSDSMYENFDLNDPVEGYYVKQYTADFGKDDFLFVGAKVDDVLGKTGFEIVKETHEILANAKTRFDVTTGKVFWPDNPSTPLVDRIRRIVKPTRLDVEWNGDVGTLKPTPAELRKNEGPRERPVRIYKQVENGRWVGYVDPILSVVSLKNNFVPDSRRIMPLTVEEALMVAGEPGELSKDEIEKSLLQSPFTGSLLISNIEAVDAKTGNDIRGPRANYMMLYAVLEDLRDRNDLREALIAQLAADLRVVEQKTGSPLHIAGTPVLQAKVMRNVVNSHVQREPLFFVILIAIMLVLFGGSFRALLFPLLVVVITQIWSLGLFQIFGGVFNWLTACLPVVIIVMSVGIAIHVLQAYQEEWKKNEAYENRFERTLHRMVRPCFLTTLTTIVGFLSLALWPDAPWTMKMFGIFGAVGLAMAYLLTFVIFTLMVAFLPQGQYHLTSRRAVATKKNLWFSLLFPLFHFLKRHAFAVIGVAAVILVFSVWGASLISTSFDSKNLFKRSVPFARAVDFTDTHFHGSVSLAVVIEEGMAHESAQAELPPIPGDSFSKPLLIRLGKSTLDAVKKSVDCFRRFDKGEKLAMSLECDWSHFTEKGRPGHYVGNVLSILDFLPAGMPQDDPQKILDYLALAGELNATVNRGIRQFFSTDGIKTQVLRLTKTGTTDSWLEVSARVRKDLAAFCGADSPNGPRCIPVLNGISEAFLATEKDYLTSSLILVAGFAVLMVGDFMPVIHMGQTLILALVIGLLFDLFLMSPLLHVFYKPFWRRRRAVKF